MNTSLSGCPRIDASKWKPLPKWLEALEEVPGCLSVGVGLSHMADSA